MANPQPTEQKPLVNTLYATAFNLLVLGYSVIPSGGGKSGKAPIVAWQQYQDNPADESQLQTWEEELKPKLWGIVTNGEIAVIDTDTAETRATLTAEIGEPHVITPRGGAHWYIDTAGHPMRTIAGLLPGVDVRGVGGFVNIVGGKYQVVRLPAPGGLITWQSLPKRILAAMNGSKPAAPAKGKAIPDGQRNASLTRIAGAMRRQGADQGAIEAALFNVVCETPLPENEIRAIAASVGRYEPQPDGEHSWYHLTDYGNAERLAAKFGDTIRYNPERKMWLLWNGKYWEWDFGDIRIKRLAKKTIRGIYHEAAEEPDDKKRQAIIDHAKRSEQQARIEAMLVSLQSEPGVSIFMEQLDTGQMLLNVNNGTINLQTMKLQTHDPQDYITRIIPLDYDAEVKGSLFEAFLDRIFRGNAKTIDYVQKCYGLAITGSWREQAFFYENGSGANGKTTLNGVVLDILADYAGEIDPIAFMVDKNRKAGPDEAIASLYNKRFVVSTELTDGGRALDVGIVKRMTGGEKLRCERKYEHGFDFKPTHKLFLVGNHDPIIKDTTPAIWRRLKKIPFTVQIPPEEQVKDLREQLVEHEGQAILAWLVEGCNKWQLDGLQEPPEVLEATTDYRQRQDILHDFVTEQCKDTPGTRQAAADVYKSYKAWCEANDTNPIGKQRFNERMRERGYKDTRGTGNRLDWENITVSPGGQA